MRSLDPVLAVLAIPVGIALIVLARWASRHRGSTADTWLAMRVGDGLARDDRDDAVVGAAAVERHAEPVAPALLQREIEPLGAQPGEAAVGAQVIPGEGAAVIKAEIFDQRVALEDAGGEVEAAPAFGPVDDGEGGTAAVRGVDLASREGVDAQRRQRRPER